MGRKINIENMVLINLMIFSIILIFPVTIYAQVDKKYIREGNREYKKNKFSESEILYRKAIDKNKQSPDAVFNIGDALYKQNKFEDAGKQFIENANLNEDKIKKSAGLYNLGNSLLQANKVQESIEAYKNSLKLRPDSKEAKYNLAYAQDLLKKQEQQKQQQKDQDNQDKNKDQDKNEDQNKDQDKNKEQNNQDNKQDKQQQQQQGISKEDAQRLLNALANDEKKVQEKVKLEKAAKARVRTVKNW